MISVVPKKLIISFGIANQLIPPGSNGISVHIRKAGGMVISHIIVGL